MKIAFIVRHTTGKIWGGDIQVVLEIADGLKSLECEVRILPSLNDLASDEFPILICNNNDLRSNYWFMKLYGLKYGVIPFYEDMIQHYSPSVGFYMYICRTLLDQEDQGFPFSLERLFENPSLIYYYAVSPKKPNFKNYDVLKDASLILANSFTEAATIKRDVPTCDPKVVRLKMGYEELNPSDEFLHFTGLKKREYILDVGRIEIRKNQLASIVATKDFDAPFVFISTRTGPYTKEYQTFFLEAIKRWRKGPTLILSQHMEPCDTKNLKIIRMPEGEKLSQSMLASAYANAGLHLHPAFCEMPGCTYFEAAKFGIPTIASSWSSCRDYFIDHKTGEYTLDDRIEYCEPYDIASIRHLVQKKFGKIYPREPLHPVFQRTKENIAGEVLSLLEQNKAMC